MGSKYFGGSYFLILFLFIHLCGIFLSKGRWEGVLQGKVFFPDKVKESLLFGLFLFSSALRQINLALHM